MTVIAYWPVYLRFSRRKINFSQFKEALKLLAEKKFPGTDGALEKFKEKILEGKGPVTHGVTVGVRRVNY